MTASSGAEQWLIDATAYDTTGNHVIGLDGNLAALQESDASAIPELRLVNLHGDVAATTPELTTAAATDSTNVAGCCESTEFGVPRDPATTPARYSWVGGARRSSDDLADLVLMGVRLYNPTTGRFLFVDPIPGGNPNPYTDPLDPINGYDLTGKCLWDPPPPGPKLRPGRRKKESREDGLRALTFACNCGYSHTWGTPSCWRSCSGVLDSRRICDCLLLILGVDRCDFRCFQDTSTQVFLERYARASRGSLGVMAESPVQNHIAKKKKR